MLSFATEFPVGGDKSSSDFLEVVRKWLLGSPHTTINGEDVQSLGSLGHWSCTKANESVWTLRANSDHIDSASVRYKRVDDGLEWTTTVTFSKAGRDAWVALRVFCESRHPAVRLPPAKKPVLVRMLLASLGSGVDGDYCVGSSAHLLTNLEIDRAARIMLGGSATHLPIVYVSTTFRGRHVLDPRRLADQLAGMAHVVAEPNPQFSDRLQLEANSTNVRAGSVGIYWPDGGGRRSFFIGQGFERAGDLANAIFEEVRVALTNRRPLERCTWASIQEAVSRATFDQLRAAGSGEVESYIRAFDEEVASKNELLQDAENEIARLKAEIRRYESQVPTIMTGGFLSGAERDLYPSEVAGVVLAALQDYGSRVPADSRRKHIVESILGANQAESPQASYRDRLKDLLRGFSRLDHKTRKGLEEMGFLLSEDGKHLKLVFQGDERYSFVLPKSGSDHRGGLNAATDIARLLF